MKTLTRVTVLAAMLGAQSVASADTWTLARAIEHAIEHNPDARLAAIRVGKARADLRRANGSFWPRLVLSTGYTFTNNPVMVFGHFLNQQAYPPPSDPLDFNDVPAIDNFNVSGTVQLPLFIGGKRFAARRAAGAAIKASRHQRKAVESALAFEVARAYFTLLKLRAVVKASEAAVRSLESNRELALKRMKASTLLKSEVLDVEVQLARAREDLIRSKNALALTRKVLQTLAGLESGTFRASTKLPALAVPTETKAKRAELAATRARAEAAKAGVGMAKSGYWPNISAFASLMLNAGIKEKSAGVSYATGLQLSWTLWDGLTTKAQVDAARKRQAALRQSERKLRLAISLEVTRARIRLREANERLAVASKAIAKAEEAVKLTRARFEHGRALTTQLIDAETARTQAKVRRAQAEADRRIAIAALRRALGLSQVELKHRRTSNTGRNR